MSYKDVRRAKEYQKEWCQQHKEEMIAKRKKQKLRIRNWFMNYKNTLSCVDCGIDHLAVLQFHHRDRAEKSFTIADVVRNASSLRLIIEEINKCDVVCVNCHAKRHWKEKHQTDSWEELLDS